MDAIKLSARIESGETPVTENDIAPKDGRDLKKSPFMIALAIYFAIFAAPFYKCLPRPPFVDQFPAPLRATADKVWCLLDTDTSADIALLGSSLLVYPLFLTDAQLNPSNHFYKDLRNCSYYRGCQYFEQQLRLSLKRSISVENDGLSATLNTDYKNLLDVFAKRKTRPKLVLIFLTERDFLDMYWGPDASYSPLSMMLDPWHTKIFLHNIARYCQQALPKIFDKIQLPIRPSKAAPIEQYFCAAEFLRRFLPTNYNLLHQEISSLRATLQKARNLHIEVRIIRLPVSDNFYGIIPNSARERINNSIEKIAGEFNCPILDLRSIPLNSEDYLDTWHMNAGGGHKTFSYVIDFLRRDKRCQKLFVP